MKEWENKIFSIDSLKKRKSDAKICIRHFESKFINHTDNSLMSNAVPTLYLKNDVDYEELLANNESAPAKKKRGSSGKLTICLINTIIKNINSQILGLKNLQLAREKKNIRRERMKKVAELRRADRSKNNVINEYDSSKDYFLGEREESDLEKVLISLQLSQKLNDSKTFLKHPGSIRNATNFPLLNSLQHLDVLINNNPVLWDTDMTLIFIKQFIQSKAIIKTLQSKEIDGETILNLTSKNDLIGYLNFDEYSASLLSTKLEQLRKETILRYVNYS